MSRLRVSCTIVACLFAASGATRIHASGHDRTLVVTMTNDPDINQIKVYDADSHALLQTLSTQGNAAPAATLVASNSTIGRLWPLSTTARTPPRSSGAAATR